MLIWTLIDVINGYLSLCLIKFDSITIDLSATSIIDNTLIKFFSESEAKKNDDTVVNVQ